MKKELTQREKVLDYLKKNGTITTFECTMKLYIVDLQSCIRDLKNDGYDIKSRWVTSKISNKTFKVYALKEAELNKYEKLISGGKR